MDFDEDIDALGLLCPLPVLKLSKRMREVAPGVTVALHTDDPAAFIDVQHYCHESKNLFLGHENKEAGASYFVRKAPA